MQAIYFGLLLILSGFNGVCSHRDEAANEEMCFPFRRTSVVRSPVVNQQGRPGKTGAPGPPGWFLNLNQLLLCI